MAALCLTSARPVSAAGEADWQLEASLLSAEQKAGRIERALSAVDRKERGLLLGALLSGDDDVDFLMPGVQRHLRLLVGPEDVGVLSRAIAEAPDPLSRDRMIDLLGFSGPEGFAALQRLRAPAGEARVRLGALRAIGNVPTTEALDYLVNAVATSADPVERDIARWAEARVRCSIGKPKPGMRPTARLPLVSPGSGGKAIRSALAAGGTIEIGPAGLKAAAGILKELGVPLPEDGAAEPFQNCFLSVPDFHPIVAYPYDFSAGDVAAKVFADYSWGKWGEGQRATLRLKGKPGRASLIVQEGVLGKGRVVFSGLRILPAAVAGKLGRPERNPWEEDREWFHAARDPAGHLDIWQATDELVTRHVPWGKPLAGGPVRTVVISPGYVTRDAAEFAQRLDMRWEHLPYDWAVQKAFSHGVTVGRLTPVCWAALERIVAEPRDVIVLTARSEPWPNLPVEYRERMLRLVRDRGVGLVICGGPGPFEALPPEVEAETIETPFCTVQRAVWGKGRVACLPRSTGASTADRLPGAFGAVVRVNPYGHWAQEVVWHIAWAAGREPPLHFPDPPKIDGGVATLRLVNLGPQALTGALTVSMRALTGQVAAEARAALKVGPSAEVTLHVPVEDLPAGLHYAELVARDDAGASLGWGCFPVRAPGAVEIEDLKFDRPMYRPGDKMVVRPIIVGRLPAGSQGEARLLDRYGRLCGRWAGPMDADPPALPIEVGRPLWRYVTVEVIVRDGEGAVIARFEKPWIVDVPAPPKDFPYMAWGGVIRIDMPIMEATRLIGVDWAGGGYESCLTNGLLPWIGNFGGLGLGNRAAAMNYEANPCTLGPTFHQWRLNYIPRRAPDMARAGVATIIDQDEEGLGGEFGFHPASLHELRKHLKIEYGTLAKLNAVWQTAFGNWDEVMPMRLSQVKGRGSLAPMVDLRMFQDTAYLHHVEFDRFVLESHGMSDVRLGLSTSGGGFSDGWDIWKASQMLTCMIRQGTGNREKFRSWARPDMVLGRWTGGYYPDDVPSGRFMPWHQLLNGSSVYATWEGGFRMARFSLFRGDGRARDGIAEAARNLKEMWSGPATLIRRSTRVPPRIGIHYSRASQMAGVAEWSGQTGGAAGAIENFCEMQGHQFRYISYEEIEQGFCDEWRPAGGTAKCLFLPLSTCLSAEEARGLRRFVEQGGTLVADCDTGARDKHGGPAGRGQLADVFGCEWVSAPRDAKAGKAVARLTADGAPAEIEVRHAYTRIASVTTGKPLGTLRYAGRDHPAWIVHSFGKGKALTLNFLPGRTSHAGEVLRAVLAEAGVRHEVGVLRDGESMPGVERCSFQDGAVRYTGILPFMHLRGGWGALRLGDSTDPIANVALRFPVKAHLYNVRSHKYLGLTDTMVVTIDPGVPLLFAHLPYKVRGVKATAGPGGIGLQILPGGAAHAVRVQLFEPAGRERPEYGRVLHLPNGAGELTAPLVTNDPVGAWRIKATDAVSGASAEAIWEVKR